MGFVYLVLVMTSLEGSMLHRGKAAFLCRFQGVEVSRCRGVEVSSKGRVSEWVLHYATAMFVCCKRNQGLLVLWVERF